jgi:hypothetical protein
MAIFIGVFSVGAATLPQQNITVVGIYSFLKFLVNTNSIHILILNTSAGVSEHSMGGLGTEFRPARLHRLAESIPWNRLLSSLNVKLEVYK